MITYRVPEIGQQRKAPFFRDPKPSATCLQIAPSYDSAAV
jgi:hypothetical protein